MATTKRNVSFFLMDFRKTIKDNDIKENKVIYQSINKDEVYTYLLELIDKSFVETKNKKKVCKINMNSDDIYIEVVEFTKKYSVFKIGHEKATNTYDIRDKKTYISTEVPIKDHESLEMYTYCFFDHSNYVCAIIDVYGAPTVAAFRTLFSHFFYENYENEGILVTCSSILTRDIIKELTKKDVISNVTAEIAIPQSKILDEYAYVDRNEFKGLQNVKTTTVTFNLVSQRNKNLFVDENQLLKLFENMKEKHKENLKKFYVKAKNKGESMSEYNILEYRFTKHINLTKKDVNKLSQDDIVSALKNVYTKSVKEISEFIR